MKKKTGTWGAVLLDAPDFLVPLGFLPGADIRVILLTRFLIVVEVAGGRFALCPALYQQITAKPPLPSAISSKQAQ